MYFLYEEWHRSTSTPEMNFEGFLAFIAICLHLIYHVVKTYVQ
jgi:hypothetical protein